MNQTVKEYSVLDDAMHKYKWNTWYRYGKYLLCIFRGICNGECYRTLLLKRQNYCRKIDGKNGCYLTLRVIEAPYKIGENSVTIRKSTLEDLRSDFPMAEELNF